jgi:hypothetical protein
MMVLCCHESCYGAAASSVIYSVAILGVFRRAAGWHDPLRQQYHYRGFARSVLGRLRPNPVAPAELHPTIRSNDNDPCWWD